MTLRTVRNQTVFLSKVADSTKLCSIPVDVRIRKNWYRAGTKPVPIKKAVEPEKAQPLDITGADIRT